MAMTAAVKDELSRVTVTKTVRPQGRDRHDAAVRRRAAPRRRPHRRRGRAGHRLGGPPAAQGDRRGLRARLRGAGGRRRRPAQGQPLPRPGGQGRRGAGPAGRPGRPARPAGTRPAAPRRRRRHRRRRGGLARRVPRARLADRAGPGLRAGDHLPVHRGGAGAGRRGRRLGVSAKAREVRGADRVVVRDGDAIGALLTRLGAHESVLAWEERRMRREVRATANRLANFDDANLRRSARAAVAAGARVRAGAGDPRRRRPGAPARRPAGCAWSTSRPRWRSWARCPTRR